ncbi:DUF2471 family protein [Burkholderia gladioli]|uniref:DUF2471 family protein n=1 Tax=Burkholderia gladioli TaxID=28095 RepID=UPI00264C617B|nr:DUF2471 family protein [Burkholderia gladioli]MDN7919199.1 DUF2471 family protein [Burkholderia gladioli]
MKTRMGMSSERDAQVLAWLDAHVGEKRVEAAAHQLENHDGQQPDIAAVCRYLGLDAPIIATSRFADTRALWQRRRALRHAIDRQQHSSPSASSATPARSTDDALLTRAYRLAAAVLERAMLRAIDARLASRLVDDCGKLRPLQWQTLLDIETVAYLDPVVAEIDPALRDAVPRLRGSHWMPADLNAEVDLLRDDDGMPLVMLVVRAVQRALLAKR